MAKERPPKFCEECGKKLRSNYRPTDVVCGQPKWNGTAYSKCQRDRLIRLGIYKVAQDTTGKKCKVCDKVMEWKFNATQKVCKYPVWLRRYLKEKKTPCEKVNMKNNGENWNKVHRRTKREIRAEQEFFLGKEESDMVGYAPLIEPPVDNKQRKCIGILSQEGELGEHYFTSKGAYNRICPKCVESAEMRELSHYKDDSEGASLSMCRHQEGRD